MRWLDAAGDGVGASLLIFDRARSTSWFPADALIERGGRFGLGRRVPWKALSDERHRALREAAVKRRKTIGQLIEESLDFYGIKTARSAEQLVAKARAHASISESDALRLALAETRVAPRR